MKRYFFTLFLTISIGFLSYYSFIYWENYQSVKAEEQYFNEVLFELEEKIENLLKYDDSATLKGFKNRLASLSIYYEKDQKLDFDKLKDFYNQVEKYRQELLTQRQKIIHSDFLAAEELLYFICSQQDKDLGCQLYRNKKNELEHEYTSVFSLSQLDRIEQLLEEIIIALTKRVALVQGNILWERFNELKNKGKEKIEQAKSYEIDTWELSSLLDNEINVTSSTYRNNELSMLCTEIEKGLTQIEQDIEKEKNSLKKNMKIASISPLAKGLSSHIEVYIKEQVLRYFEDAEQIFASYVVTGKKGWETPLGEFSIQAKIKDKILRMDEPDYYRIPVSYWMPVVGGVGIHDAVYRSRFGPSAQRSWNGSHGCINAPLETAAFLWKKVKVGTKVFIFQSEGG